MATWILTASPENHAATVARGFEVIGRDDRRRPQGEQVAEGDRGGLLGRMRDGSPALGR